MAGGVLHIGADDKTPWKNRTYLSKRQEELVSSTGSRYSPASPCGGLEKIENSDVPCVFVGKPCDVTGLRMAQAINPEIDNKTSLAIGFFCAGTPSTMGTLDLFRNHNVDPNAISEFRYRVWVGRVKPQHGEKMKINPSSKSPIKTPGDLCRNVDLSGVISVWILPQSSPIFPLGTHGTGKLRKMNKGNP